MSFATVNPFTNATVETFSDISDAQLDAVIERAHTAYQSWRRVPVTERAAIVKRAGELMLEREDYFANLLTLEMGKLIKQSHAEVKGMAAPILAYYGENGPGFLADEKIDVRFGEAVVRTDPIGVLIGVEPWNFPLYQVVRFAAPNLVIGNTILLKHAGNCPKSALALEQLFHDAGVPAGVYTNVFISTDQVARAIANPLVQGVSLTGSERAGEAVGEAAGKHLKKVVLELGGSDAFIVLDGENLERTVKAAVYGRMANTGQSCVAAKRFIVVAGVYDAFVAALKTAFEQLKPGDPMDPATTLGPLSSERAAQTLIDQISDTVRAGATLVTGGGRVDRPGAFVQATILTGVTPGMRAYREELFGPAAVIYRVADDDAAVALANDSPFGLGGSVFSSDIPRARAVAERIDTGMVWINHPTSSLPNLPFGGVKRSGIGRELSHLGMNEFVNKKLICTLAPDAKIMGAGG
jgi:succinate-semialdehyde dehydrogenase/glutarate-semialdehyde dehydrogenase